MLNHLPLLVRTFRLFNLIQTKLTGLKPHLDHGSYSWTWFDWNRWSQSRSDWAIVCYVSSVKILFWKVKTFWPITGSYGGLMSEPGKGKKRTRPKWAVGAHGERALHWDWVRWLSKELLIIKMQRLQFFSVRELWHATHWIVNALTSDAHLSEKQSISSIRRSCPLERWWQQVDMSFNFLSPLA